jgi:hypothetical protein
VRASVHQGTDFPFANVCGKFTCQLDCFVEFLYKFPYAF